MSAEEQVTKLRELHKPVPWSPTSHYFECNGCDPGSYAESAAEWPCKSADILYSAEEIATAKEWANR